MESRALVTNFNYAKGVFVKNVPTAVMCYFLVLTVF